MNFEIIASIAFVAFASVETMFCRLMVVTYQEHPLIPDTVNP
jgi:hypothetical protein